jgi:hypothetical protein
MLWMILCIIGLAVAALDSDHKDRLAVMDRDAARRAADPTWPS